MKKFDLSAPNGFITACSMFVDELDILLKLFAIDIDHLVNSSYPVNSPQRKTSIFWPKYRKEIQTIIIEKYIYR